uniref:Uncharacterized protein n=1 Tax=Cannabis sativa TaxID=3483 RepID=A0A803P3B4_CANSA
AAVSFAFSRRRKARLHSLLLSGEEGSDVSTINFVRVHVFSEERSYGINSSTC